MWHRAQVGDFCISVRTGQRHGCSGGHYHVCRVASVSSGGWIESTRNLLGKSERQRRSDETIYLIALRAGTEGLADELARRCENRAQLQQDLRPLCDPPFEMEDRRVDAA